VPKPDDKELALLRKENAQLKKSLERMETQLQHSNETITDLRKLLIDLQEKLDILIAQFKKRNRRDYGDKTERHNPRPALVETPVEPTSPTPKQAPKPRNHTKHILNQSVPTQPVPHAVSAECAVCPDCTVMTVFVSNEVTYQLERLKHSLVRLQHEQEVRACPKCKKYVVTAEKPCPPIPGSYVGPGLLADICVSKLADGLPNYRQEKRYKREEAIIPRSTQSDWTLAASLLVEPLYELLKRQVLSSRCIQTDDTNIKIQDRKHKRKMRKGKMTVYRGDEQNPAVIFDFSPDLSFDRNKKFFQDFIGFVQADAAGGFDALFKDGSRIEVGCNAHSRRKYYEALVSEPKKSNDVLDIYHALYKIEEKVRTVSPGARLAARQSESKPLIDQLHATVLALRKDINPSNLLAKAAEYTLRHWIALTKFVDDPELEIDNNSSEREIKDFVLDRKNFLFAGSDAGGKAIAILLSLIASAKRNKIDPQAYLTDVFTRINSMKTSELGELIPDRWAITHRQRKLS